MSDDVFHLPCNIVTKYNKGVKESKSLYIAHNAQRCVLPVYFPVDSLKVAFFQKVRLVFQISKSPKNFYSKSLS